MKYEILFLIILIFLIIQIYLLEINYDFIYKHINHNYIYFNRKQLKKLDIVKKIVLKNDSKINYFNPSIFFDTDIFYIIKRINKIDKRISRYITRNNYIKNNYQNVAILEKRDKNFNIIEQNNIYIYCKLCKNAKIFDFFTPEQFVEDIRIIKIEEQKIYISYTINNDISLIGIGYIDIGRHKIYNINHINIITSSNNKEIINIQKNWQIINNPSKEVLKILSKYDYNKDKHLLMLTYATPLWIVSIIDIEKGNKIDISEFTYNLGEKIVSTKKYFGEEDYLKKKMSNIRCTTSLEIIDEQYYITVLHTCKPYASVFCLVDINTLEPKFLYGPVKFTNGFIEYPSTIKVIDNLIYLGLGINDSKSEIYIIKKEDLLNKILE